VSALEYRAPGEVAEAVDLLAEHGIDARVLAGGTALVLQLGRGLAEPRVLVGLQRVPGLAGIAENGSGLSLGARTTLRDLETSPLAARHLPVLGETLAQVATVRIRNQATVGGSVAHRDPRLDLSATLAALAATVVLTSTRGERRVDLAEFCAGHGGPVVRPDELVTEVQVPFLPPRSAAVYLKYLPTTVADYGTVGVAARLTLDEGGERVEDVRIALAGAGPATLRPLAAEDALRGRAAGAAAFATAADAAAAAAAPFSDARGSAEYKRAMVRVFTGRALDRAFRDARRFGA
jgi:carbon-monoxide dehydrogenase medium subunit